MDKECNGMDTGDNMEETYSLTQETDQPDTKRADELSYRVNEIPPIGILLSIGLQHVLMVLGAAVVTAYVIADVICAAPDHPIRAKLFSTTLLMAGICTILQSALGLRLPIFQGPSSTFLVPLLAMKSSSGWRCEDTTNPVPESVRNVTFSNISTMSTVNDQDEEMNRKLREMSGSLMVASVFEVLVGCTGLVGFLLKFIGPMTIAPSIALIGISLYKIPINFARTHWGMTAVGTVLVLLFALYLNRINIPIPCGQSKTGKRHTLKLPIFQMFPILLSILITWGLCGVLTVANQLPDDPADPQFLARTDAKLNIITSTPWFYVPHPGQFGVPSFNTGIFIGFLAVVISSTLESIGDYFTCPLICEEPLPPTHAVNRGIFLEGLGSVLSGLFGAAHATTSYSTNIALVGITRVASRSCLVAAGVISILFSVIGKIGAVLSSMPDPALGGAMFVSFGILTALGIFNLRSVDLTSSRNLAIFGVSLYIGIVIPEWMDRYPDEAQTDNAELNGVIRGIVGTPMFLGGVVACILDNTVKGSPEERGLVRHKQVLEQDCGKDAYEQDNIRRKVIYNVPYVDRLLKKFSFCGKLPFIQGLEEHEEKGSTC